MKKLAISITIYLVALSALNSFAMNTKRKIDVNFSVKEFKQKCATASTEDTPYRYLEGQLISAKKTPGIAGNCTTPRVDGICESEPERQGIMMRFEMTKSAFKWVSLSGERFATEKYHSDLQNGYVYGFCAYPIQANNQTFEVANEKLRLILLSSGEK